MHRYEYAFAEVGSNTEQSAAVLNIHGAEGWQCVGIDDYDNKTYFIMQRESVFRGLDTPKPAAPVRVSAEDDTPDFWRLTPAERTLAETGDSFSRNDWVYTRDAVEKILKGRGRR